MFTGIITNLGKISEIKNKKLKIATDKKLLDKLNRGDSISVDGVCLTVADVGNNSFGVEIIPETESKTSLQYLKKGSLINLELPATSNTFLSGHIVQGHVDGLGELESIKIAGNSRILKFSVPSKIAKYLVEKGSVAINGISLTIIEVKNNQFSVGIIPHTWKNTMLKNLKLGDFVNLEVDILAKYLERLSK